MDYKGAWASQKDGSHYKGQEIQTMHFSMANGLNALEHSAIKYVCRKKHADRVIDLEKAKHCIDMLIEWEKGEITAEQLPAKMDTVVETPKWQCTSCPVNCGTQRGERPTGCIFQDEPTEWVKTC